ICDIINDLIISIRRALSGERAAQISEYDREAFSGLLKKAEEMERVLREALETADTKPNAREEKNTAGAVKSSVKRLRDGRKYVQADRQVIFGNDPESWSEQLEDYINGKIRRGKNVELIAEDGEVLTLTADTAGKVSSMFNNDGTTMSEAAFERKVNAGSHIDELAQVSVADKKGKVPDTGARHGEKASGGWNYRTAYFKDFDGKYYQCAISVMTGTDGNAVYNIGQMRERSFPTILGSSGANTGALNQKTSFDNSISEVEENVNTKSSRKRNEEERGRIYELERENKKQKKLIEQLRERMRGLDKKVIRGAVDRKEARRATRELINRYGGESLAKLNA
ncbi:MAG: hypothetical protein IJN09_06820, partial [Oscillospiraceae bacterium]|nr:hypothetical protein [Oscillospiraceae bacterium]